MVVGREAVLEDCRIVLKTQAGGHLFCYMKKTTLLLICRDDCVMTQRVNSIEKRLLLLSFSKNTWSLIRAGPKGEHEVVLKEQEQAWGSLSSSFHGRDKACCCRSILSCV